MDESGEVTGPSLVLKRTRNQQIDMTGNWKLIKCRNEAIKCVGSRAKDKQFFNTKLKETQPIHATWGTGNVPGSFLPAYDEPTMNDSTRRKGRRLG